MQGRIFRWDFFIKVLPSHLIFDGDFFIKVLPSHLVFGYIVAYKSDFVNIKSQTTDLLEDIIFYALKNK